MMFLQITFGISVEDKWLIYQTSDCYQRILSVISGCYLEMAGPRSVQLDVILCVFSFTRSQKYRVLRTRLRDGCSSFRAKKSSFLGLGCAPSGWQKNRHLLILSLPRVLKEEFLPGIVFEIIIIHLLNTFVTRILALVHSRKKPVKLD